MRRSTEPQLKVALIEAFGSLLYCDPDEYPVAHGDPAELAAQHLPEIRADAPTWAAIATHLGLDPGADPDPKAVLAIYQLWKQLRAVELTSIGTDFGFDELFIPRGAQDGAGEHVTGSIGPDGTIVIGSREPSGPPPCPICLARGTAILTPNGPIAVESLAVGDAIWTLDRSGGRVVGHVLTVADTPVPASHRVVHLVLADGRTVIASPGHPLADGRSLGDLRSGTVVDGSTVLSVDLVAYSGGRTFDLVVSGPTGVYLAGDGIPLASTIDR